MVIVADVREVTVKAEGMPTVDDAGAVVAATPGTTVTSGVVVEFA